MLLDTCTPLHFVVWLSSAVFVSCANSAQNISTSSGWAEVESSNVTGLNPYFTNPNFFLKQSWNGVLNLSTISNGPGIDMGPGGSGGSILNLTLWNGGTLNQGPALAIAAAGYYYPLNSTFNLTSFYQMQYFGGSSSYMMGNNCTAAKVYVIYLSAYNFASYNVPARFPSVAQASIIQNYIGGISSTPYWNVVKRYTGVTSIGAQKINVGNLGFNPATSVIKVACDGNAPTSATGWFNSPVKSCNSTKADVENIISAAITNIWLPNDLNGIYLVVGAPEVSHSLGPYLLGKDTCSYHAFFQSQSNALTYIYSYVAIPNFSSISTPYGTKGASQCFNANTRFSPNGDPQVDAAVNYINHEIIEAIIQPMPVQVRTWIDFNWQEVMDKCEYFFLNTTASSATPSVVNTTYLSNIQIGSMNYLLNPVFDVASNTCLMSAPTTAAPVCIHAPAVNGLCGPQVSSSYPFVLGTTCRDNSGACYGCYWGSANKSAPASNNGYNLNWKLNGGTCQPWLSQCP